MSENDSSNPLQLFSSDHPGLMLVSKKLNCNNYHSWCRAIRISLSAKNKIGFITGKIVEPDEETRPDDHASWQRCNDMVLSWILNSLEPELADSVLSCDTPQANWEDLRERFSQGNAPHIFQIQRDIYKIEQNQMSIAAYYSKLKGLWDELSSYSSATCTCNAQNDRTRLMQFLMGLNESYAGTRGQILLMNPLPSVKKAYASLTQEEKQRELTSSISSLPSDMAAMMVKGDNSKFQKGGPDDDFKCAHCKAHFHREATCWIKHGYPPWHPKYKGDQKSQRQEEHNKRRNQYKGGNTNRSSYKGKGHVSANNVDASQVVPSFQDMQEMIPNLNQEQYNQIAATFHQNAPQVNAASRSFSDFSEGFGYEGDDWCG